ncbi:glycosyltransferase family 4 protein [Azospirillum sp.]|uniref:glycosyltransferase family 4 protein n=1 Tax=Azospirillum sp. TaxID=34012 RepID=UPI003D71FA43
MIYIVSPGGTQEKGGMGRIVDNFTTDLRENRPDIRFEVVDSYGPGKFHLMPFYFALAVARLGLCFLAGRGNLVHIHMAEHGSVLRKGIIVALAALFRVPVVLHLHGGRFPEQVRNAGPLTRWAIRRLVAACSETVVLGDFWRRFMTEEFGAEAKRVTVLHNAVPGPSAIPLRASDRPVRLLFLGRLIKLKGIHVLLEALATEPCRARPWELVIAGDGDLETYRRQAAALGLSDRVTFTGWLDQDGCRRQLAQADVLVQPSMFEGLPMAVLEAMAHGLTIVATPVGSVGDAIEHEVTGLLVPPGEVEPLTSALVRVLDDAALRRELGIGARRKFETCFDIAVYRERLIDIYRRNARHWRSEPETVPAADGTASTVARRLG